MKGEEGWRKERGREEGGREEGGGRREEGEREKGGRTEEWKDKRHRSGIERDPWHRTSSSGINS